jgi:hypothetical protein
MTGLGRAIVAALLVAAVQPPHETPPRALWVWNAAPLLDPPARSAFLTFCEQQRIGVLWTQIATPLDEARRETASATRDGLPGVQRAGSCARPQVHRSAYGVDIAADVLERYVTPPKITFSGHPLAEVQGQLARAESAFQAYRSYAGIAIHDATGYRTIVDAARILK